MPGMSPMQTWPEANKTVNGYRSAAWSTPQQFRTVGAGGSFF